MDCNAFECIRERHPSVETRLSAFVKRDWMRILTIFEPKRI